jgi:hypothetical protein
LDKGLGFRARGIRQELFTQTYAHAYFRLCSKYAGCSYSTWTCMRT